VGILLSGFGDDGVSGLIEIKKAGGLSMIQDPKEALHGSMPCTAIREDDVDAVLKLRELAAAIVDLANGEMVDVKPPEARAASWRFDRMAGLSHGHGGHGQRRRTEHDVSPSPLRHETRSESHPRSLAPRAAHDLDTTASTYWPSVLHARRDLRAARRAAAAHARQRGRAGRCGRPFEDDGPRDAVWHRHLVARDTGR